MKIFKQKRIYLYKNKKSALKFLKEILEHKAMVNKFGSMKTYTHWYTVEHKDRKSYEIP